MAKSKWTIGVLIQSSKRLAKWRGDMRNYNNSTKRIHDRTVPYAGTGSLLYQFSHWGMTEKTKIHRVHLFFSGLDIRLKDDQAPDLSKVTDKQTKIDALRKAIGQVEKRNPKEYIEVKFNGKVYLCEKPKLSTPVKIRCNCSDATWRANYYNWKVGALFGKKPRDLRPLVKGVRPPVNPNGYPLVCKHIVNSILLMRTSGSFVDSRGVRSNVEQARKDGLIK